MSDFHDMEYIGEKIVEMADRVKVMHAAIPGAQAKWVIEVDDVSFNVVVSVAAPAPQSNRAAPDTATVAQHMKDFEAFVAQIAPKLHWKVWQDLGSDRSLYSGGFDGWQHGFGMTAFEPRPLAELISEMKAALALAATSEG